MRDRIAFRTSLTPLRGPAFATINALQDYTADVQIESLALTLALFCQGAGLDAHELLLRANRQIETSRRVKDPTLEAIAEYATGELK